MCRSLEVIESLECMQVADVDYVETWPEGIDDVDCMSVGDVDCSCIQDVDLEC